MRVISIGMGQNIFDGNSAVEKRQVEYGKLFDELHLIVFTPNDSKFKEQKLSENVFLYPTRSKIRIFYIFDYFRIIKKLFKKSQKDCIISVQDPFETGIVGALIKLFYGLPLHVQVHTDFAHKYFRSQSLLNLVRFYLAEFVLGYSDRVRVVSERVANSTKKFNKNIDILPIKIQGLTLEKSDYILQHKISFNILTVCRLEKEKNLETVIKAFKIVADKFPEAVFTIVGDGSQMDKLVNLSRIMNLESRIKLVGWKENLEEYYKNADVYISTSLYEGYGLSIVEAASYGIPLIISETGVAGEVFKDSESALICDAKDSKCLAEAVLKILGDKNLAEKMGQKALEAAKNHLSKQENYFQKYADSILKTADNFKKSNFVARLFDFKITVWKSIIFVRYFFCGISAAATNIGLLYIFTDIAGIWYLYSSILSFLVSLVVSFTLQKFVVFRDYSLRNVQYQFIKYFVVIIFGLFTNTLLMYICVNFFEIWYILAQIIAGFFVMIQNFILYKFFIFHQK